MSNISVMGLLRQKKAQELRLQQQAEMKRKAEEKAKLEAQCENSVLQISQLYTHIQQLLDSPFISQESELQSFMNKNRQLADQILEKNKTYRENITPQTPAKLLSRLGYLNKLQEFFFSVAFAFHQVLSVVWWLFTLNTCG